jgi:hypothetical protein
MARGTRGHALPIAPTGEEGRVLPVRGQSEEGIVLEVALWPDLRPGGWSSFLPNPSVPQGEVAARSRAKLLSAMLEGHPASVRRENGSKNKGGKRTKVVDLASRGVS